MKHIVLLGDSILDNQVYVADGQAVEHALRRQVGSEVAVTLRAVDGCMTRDVETQLADAKPEWTHLVISSGTQLERLTQVRKQFRDRYCRMLAAAAQLHRPLIVCTIYDSVPGLEEDLKTALALFNEVILAEAVVRGLPVIDLRSLCDEASDYSDVSSIEPSAQASAKIAEAIGVVVALHDFSTPVSSIYGKGVLA